jgi:hypothetical protein
MISDAVSQILPSTPCNQALATLEEQSRPGHQAQTPIFTEPMGHIYRAARGILKEAGLGHLDPYDMRSHAITRLLSNPQVSDQVYTEMVGHVGNAMKRRYSKQRMEDKRRAVDAMCTNQVNLCEQQAQAEIAAGKQHVEHDVRESLGMPQVQPATAINPVAAVPLSGDAFQAEVQRAVAIALAVQDQLAKHRSEPEVEAVPEEVICYRSAKRNLIAFPGRITRG